MLDRNITMEDIHFALVNSYSNIECMYNDYNEEDLILELELQNHLF